MINQKATKSTSLPSLYKFFPVFHSPTRMWDTDGTADHIGHGKYFVYLVGIHAQFVAFAEVVFDTIVAAQHHRGYEAEHFFGGYVEGTFLVGLVVKTPKAFDYLVVVCQNPLVHALAVVVEFFN
jgi:hypothetical protein